MENFRCCILKQFKWSQHYFIKNIIIHYLNKCNSYFNSNKDEYSYIENLFLYGFNIFVADKLQKFVGHILFQQTNILN